jgi:PhnB protein
MSTNLHIVFPGTCREAFAFYEKTFGTKIQFSMTFGEAPGAPPAAESSKDLILHTAMPLNNITLMGCDAPAGREETIGGFQISIDSADEAEVKRLYSVLSEGGSIQMPLEKTFWSPLFGMVTDKFGVKWMVSIPGPEPS